MISSSRYFRSTTAVTSTSMIISGKASAPTPINVLAGKVMLPQVSPMHFAHGDAVAQIGDVGRDLHHVVEVGAVMREYALDLVVGVAALLQEVAVVADVPARPVLILGADAGEIDELGIADARHRYRLGEDAFGPGAVGEFLDLDGAVLGVACGGEEGEDGEYGEGRRRGMGNSG